MPVPDQLSPATTPLRKLPSCNHEIVFISPSDTEPVGRVASLTFLPCDEKAFQLGRRFGSRLGEETLCESLFWGSEGTSKEAEIERRNGKVIFWLGLSAAVVSLLIGMFNCGSPRRGERSGSINWPVKVDRFKGRLPLVKLSRRSELASGSFPPVSGPIRFWRPFRARRNKHNPPRVNPG
jgi:hypothetical protein